MTNPLSAVSALPAGPVSAGNGGLPDGLTSDEARGRLEKFGPNAVPDTSYASIAHGARKILGARSLDA